jgi:hypothetical protein
MDAPYSEAAQAALESFEQDSRNHFWIAWEMDQDPDLMEILDRIHQECEELIAINSNI